MPQKVVKEEALVDFLVDHPIPDDWKLNNDLLGEDVFVINILSQLEMYFDGAVRQDCIGAGAILISLEKQIFS